MEESGHPNGQQNGLPGSSLRLAFGSKSHQTMPAEWAEWMLKELRRTAPAKFRKLLAAAADEAD